MNYTHFNALMFYLQEVLPHFGTFWGSGLTKWWTWGKINDKQFKRSLTRLLFQVGVFEMDTNLKRREYYSVKPPAAGG